MEDNLNKKNLIIYFVVLILSILFIIIGNKIFTTKTIEESSNDFYTAKVIEVETLENNMQNTEEGSSYETKTIKFKAKILNKDKKGEIIDGVQSIDPTYVIEAKELEQKDKIIITKVAIGENSEEQWTFAEYYRSNILIWLVVAFLCIILILGKAKGLLTIISLIFTTLSIFLVYIPGIIVGYNIYILTIIVSIYIILMSLLIINGANKKTFCAIIGNVGGLVITGIIAYIMSNILNITGVVDEQYVFLMNAGTQLNSSIDLIGVVWGGIVIGSLGAVMDVAMSISSAMQELSENMEEKTFKKMLKSGMNIGKDAIGTMTNTLILAYVGSSLATVLLLVIYNKSTLYLFNMEKIIVEILQSIVGSMGILFAVPATALIAAYVFSRITFNDMNKYIKSTKNRDIKL